MSGFERWYKNSKYQLSKDNTRLYLYEAWQAATAERDKLVTELQAKNSELSASINALREALETVENKYAYSIPIVKEALSKTPAQSLQEHDNEVIEKCANVCESSDRHRGEYFATKIRALRGNV